MGKLNKSKGNMYDWVSHMWSPGRGCSHDCEYCYVKSNRYLPDPGVVFIPDEPFPALGNGKTIFVGHTCDLWADEVPREFIVKVLNHCFEKQNSYVFQTKNPSRYLDFDLSINHFIKWVNNLDLLFGTTIETNRENLIQKYSKAPAIQDRIIAMSKLRDKGFKTFITIEPLMDFDLHEMMSLLISCSPSFVNIGADSKKHNLPEPGWNKVTQLIHLIKQSGIEIRNKENLKRLNY